MGSSNRDPVIGIDLGTTYSAVATVEEGRPRVIPNRAGGRLTPSMIGFTPQGERVIGEAARALLEQTPANVAFATKRFIGRRWSPELAAQARVLVPYPLLEGPSGEIRIQVAGQVMPLSQVSAMILGELKLDAQAYFGKPVTKAVITVPANFDDGQRQATKEAAAIAGLEVLRIINEPTAAAVAYGLTNKFEGRALVFDLGGGTFDVSILEVQNGVFEVKATGGDPQLGGEDFDNRIVLWLLAQIPPPFNEPASSDPVSLAKLKSAAERAKRELSNVEEAALFVQGLGDNAGGKPLTDIHTVLTRKFFETLSEPLSKRCIEVCEQVMREAGVSANQVDALLLVGGMTRVPLVRRLVAQYFGKEPAGGLNPDEVVALGAAVHASELANQKGAALLLDVASHSLGVGMLGGKMRRLIPKNTPIPVVARELFVPGRTGQTEARITVYQGESDDVRGNTKLGEVVLKDLGRAQHRSEVPIEVQFELGTDGTLSVRATDTTTGLAQGIKIEARTELSSSEVEKLKKAEGAYAAVKAKEDQAAAIEGFQEVLGRGEKLLRVLQQSADENPSAEAKTAVASVQALLDAGRTALGAKDPERLADVSRKLERIISGQR